jgi:RNA polymerase sigma-70 factor (ECF subfamily)
MSAKSSSAPIRRLIELLERSSRGDNRAFAELHALTKNKMRKTILSINPAPSECDDLLQEGYLKIWRNAANFDARRASPMTWMIAIMRNSAIDSLRARRLQTSELDDALDVPCPQDPAEWNDLDYHLARPIAWDALNALPEDRRTLIELAYIAGESRLALSRRFGVPVGTIKTWLRRALESARAQCLAATQARDGLPA